MYEVKKQPVTEQCLEGKGCERVEAAGTCQCYEFPAAKWRPVCPMASHIKIESNKTERKVRVGQQKQKRKSR